VLEIIEALKKISEYSDQLKDKIPTFKEANKSLVPELGKKIPVFKNYSLENFYVNSEAITKNIPRNDGKWAGKEGDSKWIPEEKYIPQKGNPDSKTWNEILKEKDIDGINYEDGEPDFSEIAEDTVEIDDFCEDRVDNFSKADEKMAEKWNKENKENTEWDREKVEKYRKDNSLTWHERGDMKTMDLVPKDVHNNISHSGGISAYKNKMNTLT
jgi:hypothetical protein